MSFGLVVSLSVATSGCGVIFGGTRQLVTVGANPVAATVKIDPAGEKSDYTTPASISLERKNNYVLNLSAPGYTTAQAEVQKSMRGGILAADILLTSLIGVIVDGITGAWYKLTPKDVNVTLKKTSADVLGPDTITVTLATDKKKLQLLHVASSHPGVVVQVAVK